MRESLRIMNTGEGVPQEAAAQRRWPTRVAVALLLTLMVTQAVVSMRKKSVTVDEIIYFAAGYYHLKTGDFQLNMTNPPLMKLLAAAPLLILNPDLPAIQSPPADWSLIRQWQFAREFLYGNRVDADRLLLFARVPIVLLAAVLGFFVFRWSRDLYGDRAGLFALFMYSFSPNMLAYARLATQDLGIAVFVFVSSYYFWRFMKQPEGRSLLVCGVCVGLCLLVKTTAILLAPIFGIYALISIARGNGFGVYERLPFVRRIRPDRVRQRQLVSVVGAFCVVGLLVIVTLNVGYGFQGTGRSINGTSVLESADQSTGLRARIPIPAPAPFVRLVQFQGKLISGSEPYYFAGEVHEGASSLLLPTAILLKTPIPAMLLLTAACYLLLSRARDVEGEWLLLSVIIVTVLFFSLTKNMHGRIRYVLPIFPCFFVLASGLLRPGVVRTRPAGLSIAALCLWYLASSLFIHPHYLAYFNEFIGGPKNGYRYLVDSNLDWGQDLKGLKTYMDAKGIDRIKLGFFGSADAEYYAIDYDYLPSVGLAPKKPGERWWYELSVDHPAEMEPQRGLLAVSANMLTCPGWMHWLFGDSYQWLKDYEPIDQIGYSILIYDIE